MGSKRWILAALATLSVSLAFASTTFANNEHPGAPCWSNGLGDGTNGNALIHPYIHFTSVSSCGYTPLRPKMAVSAWRFLNYTQGWTRDYIEPCGYVYDCHQTLSTGYWRECIYRAGIEAISPLPHHYHYHHYACY